MNTKSGFGGYRRQGYGEFMDFPKFPQFWEAVTFLLVVQSLRPGMHFEVLDLVRWFLRFLRGSRARKPICQHQTHHREMDFDHFGAFTIPILYTCLTPKWNFSEIWSKNLKTRISRGSGGVRSSALDMFYSKDTCRSPPPKHFTGMVKAPK